MCTFWQLTTLGKWRLWLLSMLLCPATPALSISELSDAQLKVAFVFNFLKFTEWEGSNPGAPLQLCVFNADRELERAFAGINGRVANGRALRLQMLRTGEVIPQCQVLYVRHGARPLDLKLLHQNQPDLLSVGDGDSFADDGGVIGLIEREGQLRFVINLQAASRRQYKFSAQLLRLAWAVLPEKK